MVEHGLYYATPELAKLIKDLGGEWNDPKRRPLICLIKSSEAEGLYWAIPMGNYDHRAPEQKERLEKYMNFPDSDIRSCYYHIGRTTARSIFFVSDAIPITDKYIECAHRGADHRDYIVKNPTLISELERKLYRILSVENASNNRFRQHITDVKNRLIAELMSET